MRILLIATIALLALPAFAMPAHAGHEILVCVPQPQPHAPPKWSCIATVEGPHVPMPPLCFRDPGAWPPREVCLA
ncbi:MAG TPA: hypothetical protein VM582_01645 [Candidatus Thermoplasmatota archaeon]|nr:hypothetical protein [Candidatus Thermoplasmatota archaeon]